MELRITNPQENWLTEQILWNNEELKAAIAEKVKDYKTIAYTEDSLKDMKADRADLNKLKKAFEDERKRVKKICMEPYTKFEQQVKLFTEGVVQNTDGTIAYNLMQNDMVALRAVMRLGWEIPNPINALKTDKTKRCPFAILKAGE